MESLQQLWTAVCAFATAPTLQHMYDVMNGFNTLVWGPPMIIILLFLGIYFTIRLHFLQKYTWPAMKLSVKKVESEGMVSSFGSLAVMIGATVGTGSIIGVTTAVAEGGHRAFKGMPCRLACFAGADRAGERRVRSRHVVGVQVPNKAAVCLVNVTFCGFFHINPPLGGLKGYT